MIGGGTTDAGGAEGGIVRGEIDASAREPTDV